MFFARGVQHFRSFLSIAGGLVGTFHGFSKYPFAKYPFASFWPISPKNTLGRPDLSEPYCLCNSHVSRCYPVMPSETYSTAQVVPRAEYCFKSLFRKTEPTEFCNELGEFCEKLGEFALVQTIEGREDLSEFSPQKSVKANELGVWNRTVRNRIWPVFDKWGFCRSLTAERVSNRVLVETNFGASKTLYSKAFQSLKNCLGWSTISQARLALSRENLPLQTKNCHVARSE